MTTKMYHMVTVTIALGFSFAIAAQAKAELTALHHWKLDGNLNDEMNPGSPGTYQGGAPSYVAGVDGTGLDFTGSPAAYVDTGVQLPAGSKSMIVSVKSGFGGSHIWLGNEATGAARLYIGDLSSTEVFLGAGDGGPAVNPTFASTDPNVFHQMVLVDSGSSTLAAYQNGQLLGSFTYGGTTGTPVGADFEIGRAGGGGSLPAEAVLDEVVILNRELKAFEVDVLDSQGLSTLLSATPADTVNTGRVGYWPFDGNADDQSGLGNHGVPMSGAAVTSSGGKFGGALSLDGVGGFVEVADDASLNFGTGSFTMAGWMRVASKAGGGDHSFISKGNDQDTYALRLYEPGGIRGGMQTFTGGYGSTFNTRGGVNLEDDTWHHVAMVVDRDNGVQQYYVDGGPVGSAAITGFGKTMGNSFALRIGFDEAIGTSPTNGQIDEAALWNRALSVDEIAHIAGYVSPEPVDPGTTIPNGLTGHWAFDGDADDSSGNGHHGQTQGGSIVSSSGGKFGGAAILNGVDGFVAVPDHPDLNPGTGGFSFAGWVKLSDPGDPGNHHLMGKGDGHVSYGLRVTGGDLRGGMQHFDPWPDNFASTVTTVDAAPVEMNDAQWHHIAMVVSRSGASGQNVVQEYYVDGELKFAENYSFDRDISNDSVLRIGMSDGFGFMNGMIDDAAYWSRALTGDEIAYLGAGNVVVPEPGTTSLLAVGLLGLFLVVRRRK